MKVAILILADEESPGDLARVVNALQVAVELSEADDNVQVIFDGAATRWIGTLADRDHRYHRLFSRIKPQVTGACATCARLFGVRDEVQAAGVALLESSKQHPSVRGLAVEGFQVLTF